MERDVEKRLRDAASGDLASLYRKMETSPGGILERDADSRRARYGANRMAGDVRDTVLRRLGRAFFQPLHAVLFVIALVSLGSDAFLSAPPVKNGSAGWIILLMIAVSGLVRFVQELRARKAASALRRILPDTVTVRRGGERKAIPLGDLVVGDLVVLAPGDRVPADIRLTYAEDFFISMAPLNGESAVLEKTAAPDGAAWTKPVMGLGNLIFRPSAVLGGRGEGIVLAVGRDTLAGRGMAAGGHGTDAFRKGASAIAWVLIRFIAVLVPAVFLVLGLIGDDWAASLVFALSAAVGLMPEMLSMVITACLAKGALSMSRRETIVRNLDAMQGFGSMDVLCMDKTGTLTNETMLLEYYMDILGNESGDVLDLAYMNSVCHSGVHNPLDSAVRACRAMPGREAHFMALEKRLRKWDEIPFDSARKMVSTLVSIDGGESTLITKGEVGAVLARVTHAAYGGKILPMGPDGMKSAAAIVDAMLEDGMKVVAVARKSMGNGRTLTASDESGLTLVGYLAFFDAPKPSAARSVAALTRLHVVAKVLTGDRREVAASICRRVGIPTEEILTGEGVARLTDGELQEKAQSCHVFAELTPGDKARIVAALRAGGHTVGFLGDGINDLPALNGADVGISVDTAVDAVKDTADVILLRNDLAVLEAGILEGRKTFANMLKYIRITASSNFGNILSIVLAAACLPFLPMMPLQILVLNLIYDMLCIALPWDHVDKEEMEAPREWSGRQLPRFMLCFGPVSSLFDLLTFFFLYYVLCPAATGGALYTDLSDPAGRIQYAAIFQTGWFLESLWTQGLVLQFLRTAKIPFLQSRPSLALVGVTVLGMGAMTALIFTGGGILLGLAPLPLSYALFLLAVAAAYMILVTLAKALYLRFGDVGWRMNRGGKKEVRN